MRVTDAHAIDEFWRIVVRCMEDLFETQPDDAQRRCVELRTKIDKAPEHDPENVHTFYHAEPIDVAMDLAVVTELRPWQQEKYLAIQRERMKE